MSGEKQWVWTAALMVSMAITSVMMATGANFKWPSDPPVVRPRQVTLGSVLVTEKTQGTLEWNLKQYAMDAKKRREKNK